VIIIYGWRWYGLAFARAGHGAKTKAFHVFYIPFLPLGQMWVTQEGGGRLRGFPMKWSWPAALLTVGVQWGLIATAIAGSALGVFGAIPMIAGTIAAMVWAFKRTAKPTGRAARGRDLTAEVLGTNCPVELLPDSIAGMASIDLDGVWAKQCPDRSPEDVAALGPRDHTEGALAYTLLAVRARRERGELSAKLADRADQILDALERTPTLPQGAPYRAELQLPEQVA